MFLHLACRVHKGEQAQLASSIGPYSTHPDTISIVNHKPNKRPPITRMAQLQVALQNVRSIMESHLEGLALLW